MNTNKDMDDIKIIKHVIDTITRIKDSNQIISDRDYMSMIKLLNIIKIHRIGSIKEKKVDEGNKIINAFQKCEQKAKRGYIEAQIELARMYYYGDGVDKNFEKAFTWFKKAALKDGGAKLAMRLLDDIRLTEEVANSGIISAEYELMQMQIELGISYYYGDGVDKNPEKAFECFKKAAKTDGGAKLAMRLLDDIRLTEEVANSGIISAKDELMQMYIKLGISYYNGDVVEKNPEKAFEWFEKAAKRDGGAELVNRHLNIKVIEMLAKKGLIKDQNTQINLGKMYYYGESIEKNPEEALKWFEKAAEKDGGAKLANRIVNDIKLAEVIINSGIIKAQQVLIHLQAELGLRYYYGASVEKDQGRAFEWFKRAAEKDGGTELATIKLDNEIVKALAESGIIKV